MAKYQQKVIIQTALASRNIHYTAHKT